MFLKTFQRFSWFVCICLKYSRNIGTLLLSMTTITFFAVQSTWKEAVVVNWMKRIGCNEKEDQGALFRNETMWEKRAEGIRQRFYGGLECEKHSAAWTARNAGELLLVLLEALVQLVVMRWGSEREGVQGVGECNRIQPDKCSFVTVSTKIHRGQTVYTST